MNNNAFPIGVAFWAKIKAKKTFFCIYAPVCFVVLVALDMCIAKYYESEMVIARESEQAVEHNRTITLNQPGQYDLGVFRTDNAINLFGYESIITSTQFLSGLLSTPVQTLSGDWSGSYEQYLLEKMHQPFWEKAMSGMMKAYATMRSIGSNGADGTLLNDANLLSREQVRAIDMMRKQITCKGDKLIYVMTIKVRSQDPLVSMTIAKAVSQHLNDFLKDYEQEKMQNTLNQLNYIAQQARQDYELAKTQKREDAATKLQVAESFERQVIVYQAQMLFHPSFIELASPQICYTAAGPSRWKMPLALTILLTLLAMAWIGRKEVLEILKQL